MPAHPRPLGLSVDRSWSVTQRTDCSDTKAPGAVGIESTLEDPAGLGGGVVSGHRLGRRAGARADKGGRLTGRVQGVRAIARWVDDWWSTTEQVGMGPRLTVEQRGMARIRTALATSH
jgi:hypothetical protein